MKHGEWYAQSKIYFYKYFCAHLVIALLKLSSTVVIDDERRSECPVCTHLITESCLSLRAVHFIYFLSIHVTSLVKILFASSWKGYLYNKDFSFRERLEVEKKSMFFNFNKNSLSKMQSRSGENWKIKTVFFYRNYLVTWLQITFKK